jgi:hypothetical protein
MKCEQVEELLSAYLDRTLALGEAATLAVQLELDIAAHLRECERCGAIFADIRRFDLLLAQLPRVSPPSSLRERIFSSPEYLELTGTDGAASRRADADAQTVPYGAIHYNRPGRPALVALPGGRSSSPTASTTPRLPASTGRVARPDFTRRRRTSPLVRTMQIAIAAVMLFTIGVGGWIGWNLWQKQAATTSTPNTFIPPAGMPEQVPLAEGMHYVFLQNGALWSASTNGSAARQLSPSGVLVAENWVVSLPLPGRSAGNMLAYIDLQEARIHTIRSDGLDDTVVPQSLLPSGVFPSSIWDTAAGMTILDSLAWSPDSATLAFVAAPDGSGATNLYLYSTQTGLVQKVALPVQGSFSQPVWSPDSTRIAFVLRHNGTESIVDYNIQNHGVLIINSHAPSVTYPGDTVLSLGWTPGSAAPAITWSIGVIGHVHSLWQQHVGSGWTAAPQLMLSGDYVQAVYSLYGHSGIGSWLLVTSVAGRAANLWRLDVTPGAAPVQLTQGRQINFVQWSPNGAHADYLDSLSDGVGSLHSVDVASANDTLLAQDVADDPAPVWSEDGQQLAYSTGTQIAVVTLAANAQSVTRVLPLHGHTSVIVWFASDPRQLLLVLSDGQQGVYFVDTRHDTLRQIDQQDLSGPILWTEVP